MVARLNPHVRTNADVSPPGSHAQHSVFAVDFVSVKNTLIVMACDELINYVNVSVGAQYYSTRVHIEIIISSFQHIGSHFEFMQII